MGIAADQQASFRSAVESNADCIYMFDPDGRLCFMNSAALAVMQLGDFAQLEGRPWSSLWPEWAHDDIGRALDAAARGEPFRFEAHVPNGRGAMQTWDVVVSGLRHTDGPITGTMAACRDVTAAFLARQESEARVTGLARGEATLRSASRIAQLGGWEFDCATRQVTFTAELVDLVGGGGRQEFSEALKVWIEEDRAPFQALIEDAAARGLQLTFEGRVAAPDGSLRWLRVMGEPEFANGWCVALRGASQDITEWRETLERIQASEQAAIKAADAMSGFLATMGHEIRTPLNGVLGMARAMDRDELPAVQRERLKVIEASGEALQALLNDLLDLSKIEAGKVALEDGIIDGQALADSTGPFAALLQDKDVTLGVNVAPSARGLWSGDPDRARQVLTNLLANAIKFTERGGIEVDLSHDGEALVIQVRDTGIGIAPERLSQVFERFVQGDGSTTRRFGGSGLGLAICRDLVTLMGGDIQVESEEGVGSTFTARFPARRIEPASMPEPAADPAKPEMSAAEGLRVLAAEDNPTNQLVLKTLLAEVGIEPVMVVNGQEAVAAWTGATWDLVLMDIQMPVMDGVTATRRIRESERLSGRARTPIIALTANVMAHQKAEYHAAGMDDVVAKPVSIAQLLQAMDAQLTSDDGEDLRASA
jgi:PAS domain S-box-containing protein